MTGRIDVPRWHAVTRAWALLLVLANCGTQANLRLVDGTELSGSIETANWEAIQVDGARIPRSQVEDIDHPGNVAATIGGLLMVSGGALAAANYGPCRPATNDNWDCFGQGIGFRFGLLTLGLSTPLFAYGITVWTRSNLAAAPGKRVALRPVLIPAPCTRVDRFGACGPQPTLSRAHPRYWVRLPMRSPARSNPCCGCFSTSTRARAGWSRGTATSQCVNLDRRARGAAANARGQDPSRRRRRRKRRARGRARIASGRGPAGHSPDSSRAQRLRAY